MIKPKVLFVGSFKLKANDSSTGGQTFASLSLVNSSLKEKIDWIKIDTTASTNKKRNPITRVLKSIKRLFLFMYHLIFSKPDFILLFAAHGWSFKEKSLMAKLGKLLNKKIVFAPRSGIIRRDLKSNPRFSKIIMSTLDSVDYLICQSKSWKIFYSNLNRNQNLKFSIINNWLDTQKYFQLHTQFTNKNNEDLFKVLFMGWITKNKGVLDLVEAFRMVPNSNIKLFMAGHGDSYDEVQENIATFELTEKIKLLGWVHGSEKMRLLSEADLFILPSYQEGYPNALLEALASGIPTIASNISSIADIITHKVNGYLVHPGNAKEISTAVLWYKNNPTKRESIIKEGLKTIKARNTLEAAVNSFEVIFKNS